MPEIPEWVRAKYAELEATNPKYGVALCAWDQNAFVRLRPWARFCSKSCRMKLWDAEHPRVFDPKRGRRAKAEAILSSAR